MLALTEDSSLKVLEGDHDNSHVVQGLSVKSILQNRFNSKPTLLVNVLCELLIFVIEINTVPDAMGHILIGEFVEDTIAAEHNKVVLFLYLERPDVRLAHDNVWVASSEFKLRLWVAECA